MIKNYLYTIGLYLPTQQRKDILKDIEASLYEILETTYGVREYSNEEIEKVILEFGHPKKVAENYLGESLTLISSDLYNEYFLALKIALIGGNIGILIASFIKVNIESINISSVISIIASMFQTSLSIFGLVTLIFFMVNRTLVKEKTVTQSTWSVDSLKEFVQDKDKVSRFELGTETVFLIILAVGLFNYLTFFSNWLNQSVLVVFSMFVIVNLILNLYLVIKGKWQTLTRIISIILDLVFAYVVIQFYLNLGRADLGILNIEGVIISIKISILFILLASAYDCIIHIRRLVID